MRKYLLSILFVMCCLLANAQMQFMGIPMGTSYVTFKQSLMAKGFTLKQAEPKLGMYYYSNGTFNGYRADLFIFCTPKSNKVYDVKVNLTDWYYNTSSSDAKSEQDVLDLYNKIGSKLSVKYGKFTTVPEYSNFAECLTEYGSIYICYDYFRSKIYKSIVIDYVDKKSGKIAQEEKDADL